MDDSDIGYLLYKIRDLQAKLAAAEAALAASCDENRSVALAEPGRTATCPLERELRGKLAAAEARIVELEVADLSFSKLWEEHVRIKDLLSEAIDAWRSGTALILTDAHGHHVPVARLTLTREWFEAAQRAMRG